MKEKPRPDTSRVIIPRVEIDGEIVYILPMDHIRTKAEEQRALDFIAEIKKREETNFYEENSDLISSN